MSTLQDIKDQLALLESTAPQRAKAAEMALAGVEAGLTDLARLGYTFRLVEGPGKEPEQFPKMFYSDSQAPYQVVVESQAEADKLGTQWRDTPQVQSKVELAKVAVTSPTKT